MYVPDELIYLLAATATEAVALAQRIAKQRDDALEVCQRSQALIVEMLAAREKTMDTIDRLMKDRRDAKDIR